MYILLRDREPRACWAIPRVNPGDMMALFSPHNGRAQFVARVARHEGISPPQVYVEDSLMAYEVLGSYERGSLGTPYTGSGSTGIVKPDATASTAQAQASPGVLGSQGIEAVQRGLIGAGISVGPTGADGEWGPCTAQAIRTFASQYGEQQALVLFGSALLSRARSTTGACGGGGSGGGGGGGGEGGGDSGLTPTFMSTITAGMANPVVWIGGLGLVAGGIALFSILKKRGWKGLRR
jgi:hypothetical protein